MEKEGHSRALQHLSDRGLAIQVLVTDRHKQMAKWLRETHPEIKHYFDVWHVAKGIKIICNFVMKIDANTHTCRAP